MSDAPEPHPVGRHRLGAHVVGKRIVVRHLLPDGRATDTLGMCLSWGDEELVVQPHGSAQVTIRVADVVTGKPIPPRPSVRHRESAHDVELHVGSLWSTMTTSSVGSWLLRASPPMGGRLRRRGNSALAMAEPSLPLSSCVATVRSFYADLGQDPLIQVQADSPLEIALGPQGFLPLGDGDAHCQLAPVSKALRAAGRPGSGGRLVESGSSCVVEYGEESVIARGEAALDGDWLGLHNLAVDPAHWRRGLGTRVMADLLDWGASLGATTAWLHVETDNEAGNAAYRRLGFVTHHTNRYLIG